MKEWVIVFCMIAGVFALAALIYVLASVFRELFRHSSKQNTVHETSKIAKGKAVPSSVNVETHLTQMNVSSNVKHTAPQPSAERKTRHAKGAYNPHNPIDRWKLALLACAVCTMSGALVWRAASVMETQEEK